MATHSSVLAWRIPGTGEPDGLPSMGSHRVGHDWSDLAAAAPPVSEPLSLWRLNSGKLFHSSAFISLTMAHPPPPLPLQSHVWLSFSFSPHSLAKSLNLLTPWWLSVLFDRFPLWLVLQIFSKRAGENHLSHIVKELKRLLEVDFVLLSLSSASLGVRCGFESQLSPFLGKKFEFNSYRSWARDCPRVKRREEKNKKNKKTFLLWLWEWMKWDFQLTQLIVGSCWMVLTIEISWVQSPWTWKRLGKLQREEDL